MMMSNANNNGRPQSSYQGGFQQPCQPSTSADSTGKGSLPQRPQSSYQGGFQQPCQPSTSAGNRDSTGQGSLPHDAQGEGVEEEEEAMSLQTLHRLTNQVSKNVATLSEEVATMIVRCQLLETDLVVLLSPHMLAATEEATREAQLCEEIMNRAKDQTQR